MEMLRFSGLALVLGLAISGLALELASPPVLLPSEPLVVYTEPGESPPILKVSGISVAVKWKSFLSPDGRIRWETNLSGLSPGLWKVATDKGSIPFVLVRSFSGIVEVLAQEEKLVKLRTSTGESYAGWSFPTKPAIFIIPNARQMLQIWPEVEAEGFRPQKLSLAPNTRIRLFIPSVFPSVSSSEVLPESIFAIGFSAPFSAVADFLLTPELVTIRVPEDWKVSPAPLEDDCPPSVREFLPLWLIKVGSHTGTYNVVLIMKNPENPAYTFSTEAEIKVVDKLPPKQVVGHWDVENTRADFSRPYAITYERLLWAISLLGKEIPHTGTTMTRELLEELAREWAGSAP